MGLGGLAYTLSKAIDYALDFTDVGHAIAKYLDKHDKKPNNGYLEWW